MKLYARLFITVLALTGSAVAQTVFTSSTTLNTNGQVLGAVTINPGVTVEGNSGAGITVTAEASDILGTLLLPTDFTYNAGGYDVRVGQALTLNGGTLLNANSLLGFGANTAATVSSSGTWTMTGALQIGDTHDAVLSITGATVSSATTTVGGASTFGILSVNGGGLLTTGQISRAAGGGSLLVNGGTLRASGSNGSFITGFSGTSFELGAGGATIDSNGFNVSVSAVISGAALTKSGTGTLTLTGANTYSSGTNVTAGTLEVGSGGVISNLGSTIQVAQAAGSAATLAVTGGNVTASGVALGLGGGTGTLNLAGGVLTASVVERWSTGSTLNFSGGTLRATSNTAAILSGFTSGSLTTTGLGATIDTNGFTVGLQGPFSGAGGLTKAGAGTLTLTGASTYSGATTASAGTLTLGASHVLPDGSALTLASGTVLNVAGFTDEVGSLVGGGNVTLGAGTLAAGGDGSSTTYSGVMSGGGTFIKNGAGTLTLTGNSTFTGQTNIQAGVLRMGVANALSSATALSISSGATLDMAGYNTSLGSLAGAGAVTTGAGSLTVGFNNGSTTFSGVISGSGNLGKNGNGVLLLAGANSYTGSTTILGGSVIGGGIMLGANEVLPDNTAVSVADRAALYLNGYDETIGSLAGAGQVVLGPGTLTAGQNNASTTFEGQITGTGGFIKTGTGTLSHIYRSDYTGATQVLGGWLELHGFNALSTLTPITIGSGAGMVLRGGDVNPYIWASLSGAGSLVLNASNLIVGVNNTSTTFAGILTGGGSFTKTGSGTMTLAGSHTNIGYTECAAGAVILTTGGSITHAANYLKVQNPSGASFQVNGGSVNVQNSYIGFNVNQTGTGTLTSGSWTSTASVELGYFNPSSGTLTVDGGTLSTPLVMLGRFGGTGTLQLNGGVVETSSIERASNGSSFSANGGTLRASAAGSSLMTGFVSGTATLGAGGLTVDTNGFNASLAAPFTGSGWLGKAGAGTLTFTGSQTYTGGTKVKGGTLVVPAGSQITHAAAQLDIAQDAGSTATFSLSGGLTASAVVLGHDGGTGTLNVNGLLTTSTVERWTGGSTMSFNGGTLRAAGSHSAFINGFTLGSLTTTGAGATIDTNGFTVGMNSSFSGAGGLTKAGAGTLTLSTPSIYDGSTTITAGTLQLATSDLLPDGTALNISAGASLVLAGYSDTVGSLAGGGNVALGAGMLTTGGNHASTSFSGVLGGTGGLTKTGTGTLTLHGVNTYSGATNILGGTLQIGSTGGLGDSSVTVASGATLDMGSLHTASVGSLSGAGSVVISFSSFSTGSSNASTTLSGAVSGTGTFTKTGTGTLTLSGVHTRTALTEVAAGTVIVATGGSITHASNDLRVQNASGASFQVDGGGVSVRTSFIGIDAGQTGTGTLNSGSWTSTSSLELGSFGSSAGTLTVNGGICSTPLVVLGRFGGTGTLQLNGGVLETVRISQSSVSSAFLANGGTLRAAGTAPELLSNGTAASASIGSGGLIVDTNGFVAGIPSILSGGGALIKTGAGTLTLGGANTYTGGTMINAGTLRSQASHVLPDAGTVVIASGAVLDLAGFSDTLGSLAGSGSLALGAAMLTLGADNSSSTYAGSISGTGGLIKIGSGTQTLSGVSSYTGSTSISAGTLRLGNGNALGSASNVTVSSGAVLDLAGLSTTIGNLNGAGEVALGAGFLTVGSNNSTNTLSLVISGSGGIIKTGTGTLTLTGSHTYTGPTTISAGGLQIGNGGTSGSLASSSISNSGTLTINSSGNLSLTAISGTGSLTKLGIGILTLTGSSTYTGPTTISAGTLQLGPAGSLGMTDVTVASGAVFDLAGRSTSISSLSGTGSVTLGSATLSTGGSGSSTVFSGGIFGTGGLTKTGAGTFTLGGASTYGGATTVSAGTLQMGVSNALPVLTDLTVSAGASLALAGNNTAVGSLAGDGNVSLGTGTLTVGASHATTTFSGALSGTGGLTKTGSGTFTLTGASTYTGTTTIATGTLQLDDGGSIASTTLSNSGTLAINRSGNLIFATSITGTGGLAKAGSGTLTLARANTYSGATSVNAGTLQVGIANALSSATAVTLAAGTTLHLAGFSTSVGSLSGGGNVLLDGAGDLTAGSNNGSSTFLGGMSGSGNFTKTGTGTLTLTGASSNTGYTDVSAGALVLAGGSITHPASYLKVQNATGASFSQNGGSVSVDASYIGFNVGQTGTATLNSGTWDNTTSVELGYFSSSMGTLTLNGGTLSTPQIMMGRFGGSGIVQLNGGVLETTTIIRNSLASSFAANGGTLRVRANASALLLGFTSGSAVLQSGGLTIDTNNFTATLPASLTGTGALTKAGVGTLTLTSASSHSGGTQLTGGTLAVGAGGAISHSAASINIAQNAGTTATLSLTGGNVTASTVILAHDGGTGTLSLNSGVLTTMSVERWTGGSTMSFSGGTLRAAGHHSALINGFTLGSLSTTGAGATIDTNGFTVGINSSFSGAGALTKTGAGTLTLDAASTHTGGTAVAAGTLRLGVAEALPDSGAISVLAGGVWDLNGNSETIGSISGGGSVLLGAGTLTVGGDNTSTSFTGTITGTGGLTKIGTGTLTLSGAGYTGPTTILGGVLKVIPTFSSAVTVTVASGATFDLTGGAHSIGSLTGSGSVLLEAGNLAIGADNTSTSFAGVISGTGGSLTKVGSGVLTFTGVNTCTGVTNISAGSLVVASGGALSQTALLNVQGSPSAALVVDGGAVTAGLAQIGYAAGNVGTLKITGGTLTTPTIELGTGGGTGRFQLHGGVLEAASIQRHSISSDFSADGGTLRATENTSQLLRDFAPGTAELLAGGLTIDTNGFVTSTTAPFSGAGGLTKTGTGTLTLTGTSNYTGATTVNAGTLSLSSVMLADTASVTIASGATLNLTHNSLDTVSALIIGGVPQVFGTWGAIGSGAQHETASITGTGRLLILSPSAFAAWTTMFGLTGSNALQSADPDADGVLNLLEFYSGSSPVSTGPVATTLLKTPTGLEFTYPRAKGITGVTAIVEWTDDLLSWSISGVSAPTVIMDQGATEVVKVTVPAGSGSGRFVRLRVTSP